MMDSGSGSTANWRKEAARLKAAAIQSQAPTSAASVPAAAEHASALRRMRPLVTHVPIPAGLAEESFPSLGEAVATQRPARAEAPASAPATAAAPVPTSTGGKHGPGKIAILNRPQPSGPVQLSALLSPAISAIEQQRQQQQARAQQQAQQAAKGKGQQKPAAASSGRPHAASSTKVDNVTVSAAAAAAAPAAVWLLPRGAPPPATPATATATAAIATASMGTTVAAAAPAAPKAFSWAQTVAQGKPRPAAPATVMVGGRAMPVSAGLLGPDSGGKPQQTAAAVTAAPASQAGQQQPLRGKAGLTFGRVIDTQQFGISKLLDKGREEVEAARTDAATAEGGGAGDGAGGGTAATSGGPAGTTRAKLNRHRSFLALVKRAVAKDPEAIAQLVGVLQPADLALLRLMAFRWEKRLKQADQANGTAAASTAPAAAPQKQSSRGVTLSLTGPGGQASLSSFLAATTGKGGAAAAKGGASGTAADDRLLGLESAIDLGMKQHIAAEKERERAERRAAAATKAGSAFAAAALKQQTDKGGTAAPAAGAPKSPLTGLLRTLYRQKLVRAWVFASLRAKLNSSKQAAAAAERVHAHLLRTKTGGGKGKKGAKEAAAASAAAAKLEASVQAAGKAAGGAGAGAGAGGGGGGGGAGGSSRLRDMLEAEGLALRRGKAAPRGVGRKSKLTRMKKLLLQERVDAWLQAHPEAQGVYTAIRSQHTAEMTAEKVAEVTARATLRAAAEAQIRIKAAKSIRRAINRGKVIIPVVRGPGGRSMGLVAQPATYAMLLAKKRVISDKHLRRTMEKLVAKGKYVHPLVAGERAREAAQAEKAAAVAAALAEADGSADAAATNAAAGTRVAVATNASGSAKLNAGGGKAAKLVLPDADTVALAARLAKVDITQSLKKAQITAAIPKLTGPGAVHHLVRKRAAAGGAGGADDEHNDDELEEGEAKDTGATAAAAPSAATAAAWSSAAQPARPGAMIRTYVDHDLSPELDTAVSEMIATAAFYQERARAEDARKAKRRLLIGLREVHRACKAGEVKLLVVAPNIDASSSEGGLDDAVQGILDVARATEPPVPIVFALSRRKLGHALGTTQRSSCVGFLSFENLRGLNNRVFELVGQLREAFAARSKAALTAPSAPEEARAPPQPFKSHKQLQQKKEKQKAQQQARKAESRRGGDPAPAAAAAAAAAANATATPASASSLALLIELKYGSVAAIPAFVPSWAASASSTTTSDTATSGGSAGEGSSGHSAPEA